MANFYILLTSYLVLLLAVSILPEKYWNNLYKINELKGQNKGQNLLNGLASFEAKVFLGVKNSADDLPKYKFYTHLFEILYAANRSLGIGLKKIIPEIRNALLNDLKFEKKIRDEVLSAFLQFIAVIVTTWAFVYLSTKIAEIAVDKKIAIAMLLIQACGLFLFYQTEKICKKKIFEKFSSAIKEIYLFSCFLDVGLPLNEALLRSGISEGALFKHKVFEGISKRLEGVIQRLKETGLSPKDEVHEIIGQIWQLQEEKFRFFTKYIQMLKFTLLVFFFLPAYFLYLYSIFKFFMEQ